MQGRALFTFIKGLEVEEYQLLNAMIGIEGGDSDARKIVKVIRKLNAYDEEKFIRQVNLTKRRIGTVSRKIVQQATGAVGMHDEEGLLHNALVTIRKLVFRMDSEPASSILTWAARIAEKHERFETLFQLHELAELLRLKLDVISKKDAISLQINLAGYRALEHRLRMIPRAGCTPEERESILQEVRNSPLMASPDQALSVRAKATYHKVLSGAMLFSTQYELAHGPQARYVEFLENTEWLKGDREFFLAKEMVQLSKLLSLSGYYQEAQKVVFRVGNIQTKSERAEQEKLKQLYPYRMQFAITTGNADIGESSLEQMNQLLNQKDRFDPLFCTENLYYGLYFCIASGNLTQGGLLAPKMRKYQSKEYHPRIFSMAKMLEIVLAFESKDFEDCARLIKNFRKSKAYPSSPAFALTTGLLNRLVNQSSSKHQSILSTFHEKAIALEEEGTEHVFFAYFDLTVWIESKLNHCSMIDIFHQRAMVRSAAGTAQRVG